jgi:hypothetical protein
MEIAKLDQQGGQYTPAETRRGADPDKAGRLGGIKGNSGIGLLQVVEDTSAIPHVAFPVQRQAGTPWRTDQQTHAETRFATDTSISRAAFDRLPATETASKVRISSKASISINYWLKQIQ